MLVSPIGLCRGAAHSATAGRDRSGSSKKITWDSKLLYKDRAGNPSRALSSLTPPIVNGNLITYRGFKEMLIFGGRADKVFSVDADLNKLSGNHISPIKGINRGGHSNRRLPWRFNLSGRHGGQ